MERAAHRQHPVDPARNLGADIDLRIFPKAWAHGFAVEKRDGDEIRRSLQFFDVDGTAIHGRHYVAPWQPAGDGAFTTSGGREDSFNHVYYRPDSDIYVVPASGGEPVRLTSNDPACSSDGSAGSLYNSWAKWAPTSVSDGERTYYFLIFSTSRNSPFDISRGQGRTSPASQLYMTTIIRHASGEIESSPAIYLWNQRVLVDAEGNRDVFPIGVTDASSNRTARATVNGVSSGDR